MGLVPVRESIVRGYTFLFARFFTVLGLGWLSAAFYGIACSWLIRAVSTGALGAPPSSGAFNQYSLGYLVAMLIVTAFFSAPMLIPFTREALGMHEEPVAAHFSYGAREWRLFVALLRFFGLLGAALFLLIVASGIAISQFSTSSVEWLGIGLVAWLNALSAVVVLSTAAFLAVRLGFFLGPIAAVEGHAKLARAWILSRANFWRLALVFLAVAIPAALVVLIVEYALWGSELEAATGATGSDALAIFKLQYDHSISISAMLATALMAVNALFAAASASAYQAQAIEAPAEETDVAESNWGIHRAPAFADAGPRIEPHSHIGDVEQVIPPEPVQAPEENQLETPAEHTPESEAVGEIQVPAELPADGGHAADIEPTTETAQTEIETAKTDVAHTPDADEPPPLDPAGLSYAAREHEVA